MKHANDNAFLSVVEIEPTESERLAIYQAAMIEWHAQQQRAKAASANYYKGGFKVSMHGAPLRLAVKPTPHMLALMRWDGFSPCKALRDMAEALQTRT